MVRRKKLLSGVLLLSGMLCTGRVMAQQWLYKQAAVPIEYRVKDLLGRMTIEEKVGQLCCPLGWEMYTKTGKNEVTVSELYKKKMAEAPVGSFWAVLRADPWTQKTLETGLSPELSAKALNALQKYAVEETRLGIPVLFAEECPHGHMAIGTTVFPTALSAARGEHWLWSGAGCCSRAALVTHGGNLWGRPSADYHHGSGYDEGNAR